MPRERGGTPEPSRQRMSQPDTAGRHPATKLGPDDADSLTSAHRQADGDFSTRNGMPALGLPALSRVPQHALSQEDSPPRERPPDDPIQGCSTNSSSSRWGLPAERGAGTARRRAVPCASRSTAQKEQPSQRSPPPGCRLAGWRQPHARKALALSPGASIRRTGTCWPISLVLLLPDFFLPLPPILTPRAALSLSIR